MKQMLKNIYHLGIKEIRGLFRDHMLLALIIYSFSLGVYVSGKAMPDSITNAAIAVVDEDHSQLSERITDAFMPPMFIRAKELTSPQVDHEMDRGNFTFVVVIPANFERDVRAGREPEIQLNVDATRMTQAFTGSGYIQQIISQEIQKFVNKSNTGSESAASSVIRNRYNPNLSQIWFGGLMQLVNNITMLAIILTGAALIRERECGTLEHLLVMPVTSFEIMVSKIWSMLLVVLVSSSLSLVFIIKGALSVPIEGSILLYLAGIALHLFAVTSLGIFLACMAQNMPQLGMLLILVLLPMQMLSGSVTPRESMPGWLQEVMLISPNTHIVEFSQSILFRGAGIEVVWKQYLALLLIGSILFWISLVRFRKSIS